MTVESWCSLALSVVRVVTSVLTPPLGMHTALCPVLSDVLVIVLQLVYHDGRVSFLGVWC